MRARLDQQQAEAAERAQINADWVLSNLVDVVERSLQRTPVLDRKGEPTGEYQFNAAGANRALELISLHIGMFTDDVKTGPEYHLHIPEGRTLDDLRRMRDAIPGDIA